MIRWAQDRVLTGELVALSVAEASAAAAAAEEAIDEAAAPAVYARKAARCDRILAAAFARSVGLPE